MKRTYRSMADELGIEVCSDCHGKDHRIGTVDHARGVIHLAEPRVRGTSYLTWADIALFFKLAARLEDPSIDEDIVQWRRVYRMNMLARQIAARIKVRVPARYATGNKAFVLAGVAGLPNSVPMRKQAFDWARR